MLGPNPPPSDAAWESARRGAVGYLGEVRAQTFRCPRNDLAARGASRRRGELGEPVSEGDHTPRTVLRRLGPILAICRSARRARARSVLGAGSATSAALLIGRRAKAAPPRPDPHGLPRSLRQRRTDETYDGGGHGVVSPLTPCRSGRDAGCTFVTYTCERTTLTPSPVEVPSARAHPSPALAGPTRHEPVGAKRAQPFGRKLAPLPSSTLRAGRMLVLRGSHGEQTQSQEIEGGSSRPDGENR